MLIVHFPNSLPAFIQRRTDHSLLTMDFSETAMAPMNGTMKRLVSDKGFGFV
jgi:hypothetical protein